MFPSPIKYFFCFISGFIASSSFAQSVGGTTSGAASFCGTSSSGFISVTSYSGSVLYWESSTNGGVTWSNIGNVTPNQSYSGLTQTTCYRAVVQSGSLPADTSTVSCITVYPPTVPGTISGGGTFCGGTGSGTLTLSGNTGAVLNWQYSTDGGLNWTTLTNTTTSLTYTNITQNTIYEAVVQNTSFCAIDTSTQASFTVTAVSNAGTLNLSGNDSVCMFLNSGSVNLSGNTGQVIGWLSSTNGGSSWTPINNTTLTQSFSNLFQNTLFEAIVQNGACPPDTTPAIGLTVLVPPTVNAGLDTTLLSGQSVTLNGSGNGTPFWIPTTALSDPAIFNPVANPASTTSYILVVTDAFGCLNSDTVVVNVTVPTFTGTVSNFFTPNGDGINDAWFIQGIQGYPNNEVFVYNIYGNEVFSKKAYTNDWKGTYGGGELPDGTYYYVIKFSNPEKTLKGSLDIIKKK